METASWRPQWRKHLLWCVSWNECGEHLETVATPGHLVSWQKPTTWPEGSAEQGSLSMNELGLLFRMGILYYGISNNSLFGQCPPSSCSQGQGAFTLSSFYFSFVRVRGRLSQDTGFEGGERGPPCSACFLNLFWFLNLETRSLFLVLAGCCRTSYVDKVGFSVTEIPASASLIPGLKAFTTMPHPTLYFPWAQTAHGNLQYDVCRTHLYFPVNCRRSMARCSVHCHIEPVQDRAPLCTYGAEDGERKKERKGGRKET